MTELEIAIELREQIKQWPYVSTILSLSDNNKDGLFTEKIQKMVDRLLPDEVFYKMAEHEVVSRKTPVLIDDNVGPDNYYVSQMATIKSLSINMILFASETNKLGLLEVDKKYNQQELEARTKGQLD